MPDKGFLHQHPQFEHIIAIIADGKRINLDAVEKDYWIMHCLYGLQQGGYDFQLKGGTSLSKGHGLIHRFSEDIDICISPPSKLNLKTGKNHNKPAHIEGRKNYYDAIAKEIAIEGIEAERDTDFDDEKCRSGGIRLHYQALFKTGEAGIKEGVLLELGFDQVTPNRAVDISSWVYEHAVSAGVSIIDNRAKNVACYEAGYTFVEKLQAISTKYRQFKAGKAFPANFMRHYYDVYCLLQDDEVRTFAETEAFEAHRKRRFPAADWEIPLAENPAFLLNNSEDFERLKKEYISKKSLYYQGQPDFEDVMAAIRDWVAGR